MNSTVKDNSNTINEKKIEIPSTEYRPTNSNDDSIIVTSALPYANGEIHIGHVSSTYLPADIFTRFLRISGKKVFHVCASDDFGTPILIKAEKEQKTPESFVEFWNRRDIEDFKSLGVSFDKFYRTSSPENQNFVQYVFNRLKVNGHIYQKEVIQFYCEHDRKYLPDRYVVGTCPYCKSEDQYSDLCEKCGRVPEEILDPKCGICGRKPVKKNTNHYFFRLSSFSKELNDWLSSNVNLQNDIKKYVLNWIKDGLQDWDITRDLEWGINIPIEGEKGKVFYGWFDNHLCYISTFVALLKERQPEQDGRTTWNSSTIYHFIGKDIVYHHFLFLPAIRIGINKEYKLPDYIPVRGHLMLHDKKISKSRNWYIGLRDFISIFKPDYLRFYIASISPSNQDDINFDWDMFYNKINNELIDNIGNFVNRTLTFTNKNFGGKVPTPGEYDYEDKLVIDEITKLPREVGSFLEKTETDKALKNILKFSNNFNQYFQKKEPWKDKESAHTTIYLSINAVRSLSIMLEPFIPFSVGDVYLQLFGKDTSNVIANQKWDDAAKLNIKPGHQILSNIKPLFKKIDKKEIEKEKSKLGSN